ncbi:DinB family protein [Pedobacter chinensis]|uniref:DinB family protein n=1 Tax=Pedobacter chinensis TaxID=2282421 RepID=A0A369Q3V5_9SPHI|nr:DinB family protein [Pedobacter chinensis]RDC57947.1 DinB family protein [Pedobacter chinensis]
MDNHTSILINELKKLLNGGGAHVGLKEALANLSLNQISERPYGLPYSIWQLAEHIRIAQWDMFEFSKDANHQSPKWPDEYWPKEPAPKDEQSWKNTLMNIEKDLKEFIKLIESQDLYCEIPHGNGQTLLREALQIADHNAYHLAEIIVIRRLIGAWKS